MGNERWAPIFILPVLLFLACSSDGVDKGVVARVGNSVLTRDDLARRMGLEGVHPEQENEYIEKWINRELLATEARKQGLNKLSEFREELNTLEEEILTRKLLEKVFAEQIHFNDQEVSLYYEKNKGLFAAPEDEIHAFHILTKTQYEANQAQQEIRAGKAFEQVAKERSTDAFRDKGGDMGFIRRSELIPEIARIAFYLAEGDVSAPVKSQYGFHIIKVVKRYKAGAVKDLNDVKDDVLERLRVNKERSVYRDLLYQLQNKYKVYVYTASGKQAESGSKAK